MQNLLTALKYYSDSSICGVSRDNSTRKRPLIGAVIA